MSQPLRIFSDLPIEKKEQANFGFSLYSNTLTAAILNTETPITFGIFGGWGTGKTSLMRLIYHEILESGDSNQFFPVWFDAWRFEHEPNLLIPLLYTIRDEIRLRHPDRHSENPYVKLANFLDSFTRSLAAGLEVTLSAVSASGTYKLKDSLEAAKAIAKEKGERFNSSLFFDMFHYLRDTIKDLGSTKLVIFVDDLDRCHSEKALQVLEFIKTIISFEGIIFIIGADREILEKTVSVKFQDSFHIDGSAFIKKMFQVIFSLPPLQEEDIQRYVEKLISESKYIGEEKLGIVSQIIVRGAGANPREIKRLVNSFMIMTSLENSETLPERRAAFLVLQQKWPETYRRIAKDKEKFIQLCDWMQTNQNRPEKELEICLELPFIKDLAIDFDLLLYLLSFAESLHLTKPNELNPYFHSASIASYQLLLPHELRFKHVIEPLSPSTEEVKPRFRWKLFPVASDTTFDRISAIRYRLPASTYPDDERYPSRESGFTIEDIGNRNSTIRITLYFNSSESMELSYFLDFCKDAES